MPRKKTIKATDSTKHFDSLRDAIDAQLKPRTHTYKFTMEIEIAACDITDADDNETLDHIREYGLVAITDVEEV